MSTMFGGEATVRTAFNRVLTNDLGHVTLIDGTLEPEKGEIFIRFSINLI